MLQLVAWHTKDWICCFDFAGPAHAPEKMYWIIRLYAPFVKILSRNVKVPNGSGLCEGYFKLTGL